MFGTGLIPFNIPLSGSAAVELVKRCYLFTTGTTNDDSYGCAIQIGQYIQFCVRRYVKFERTYDCNRPSLITPDFLMQRYYSKKSYDSNGNRLTVLEILQVIADAVGTRQGRDAAEKLRDEVNKSYFSIRKDLDLFLEDDARSRGSLLLIGHEKTEAFLHQGLAIEGLPTFTSKLIQESQDAFQRTLLQTIAKRSMQLLANRSLTQATASAILPPLNFAIDFSCFYYFSQSELIASMLMLLNNILPYSISIKLTIAQVVLSLYFAINDDEPYTFFKTILLMFAVTLISFSTSKLVNYGFDKFEGQTTEIVDPPSRLPV